MGRVIVIPGDDDEVRVAERATACPGGISRGVKRGKEAALRRGRLLIVVAVRMR